MSHAVNNFFYMRMQAEVGETPKTGQREFL